MADDLKQSIRRFVETSFLFRESRQGLADSESLLDAGLIDSTGIHAIVCAHANATEAGIPLTLTPPAGQAIRAFEIAGLSGPLFGC